MKITKSALKELQRLINAKYDVTLLISGGHKLDVKISKIKDNIVYFDLSAFNTYQIHKGWVHISDISGVYYREA